VKCIQQLTDRLRHAAAAMSALLAGAIAMTMFTVVVSLVVDLAPSLLAGKAPLVLRAALLHRTLGLP